MKFIELTGAELRSLVHPDEMQDEDLHNAGVEDDSIVRINQQGDVEIRRSAGWDVIGGLLGDFEARLENAVDRDWA